MQEPAPGGIWNRPFLFLYLSACINGGKCKCAFCTGYQTSSNFSFLRSLAPFKVEFSLFVRCFLFFFFLVRQWTLTSLLRRFSRVRTQLRTLCSLMLSTWGWVSYFVHSAHTFNFSDHNVCVWWNRRRVCVWRTAIGFCVCACVCVLLFLMRCLLINNLTAGCSQQHINKHTRVHTLYSGVAVYSRTSYCLLQTVTLSRTHCCTALLCFPRFLPAGRLTSLYNIQILLIAMQAFVVFTVHIF